MKFGLIGPGTIARKFADAASQVEGVEIACVSSSDEKKAAQFAEDFGIPKIYSHVEELLANPDIDAVYISQINTLHVPTAKKALDAGKAVLCEKPIGISLKEAEELMAYAEKKKLLLMEGLWTLHLPLVQKVWNWVYDGRIGEVKYMNSDFSFFAPFRMESRLFNPELGGGAALDVGIYTVAFSMYMAEAVKTGNALKALQPALYRGKSHVDEMGAALLTFDSGLVASCSFGIQGSGYNAAKIFGTEGTIELPEFWAGKKVILRDTEDKILEELEDPRPNGFVYEIEAFRDAYSRQETEVKLTDHAFSVECAKILEDIRKQG
jgi:predicted dehydrogenase